MYCWSYSSYFLPRLVISHRVPKYIEVTGADFRSQVLGHCEMEVNLFDALIRALRDEDDKIYSAVGDLRWRHFFESDFMVMSFA